MLGKKNPCVSQRGDFDVMTYQRPILARIPNSLGIPVTLQIKM